MWLGTRMVIQVLFISVVFVWLAAVFSLLMRKREQPTPEETPQAAPKKPARQVVAFAIPVGLATWLILLAHVVKSQAAG